MYQAIEMNGYKIIEYKDILSVRQGKKITLDNINEDVVFIADENKNLVACYERVEDNLFRTRRGGLDN